MRERRKQSDALQEEERLMVEFAEELEALTYVGEDGDELRAQRRREEEEWIETRMSTIVAGCMAEKDMYRLLVRRGLRTGAMKKDENFWKKTREAVEHGLISEERGKQIDQIRRSLNDACHGFPT